MRHETRIAGFGGQGVITIGILLAVAAGEYGGQHVAQTQSYGPEARGGACKTDVVLSDRPIDYIKTLRLDTLIVMSQTALDKYGKDLPDEGLLIIDSTLVHSVPERFRLVKRVPATELAEDMGLKVAANVCMFGALCRLTGWVAPEQCVKALQSQLPASVFTQNVAAFDKGVSVFA